MKNFSFLFEFSPEAVPKTKIGVKILHLGGTDCKAQEPPPGEWGCNTRDRKQPVRVWYQAEGNQLQSLGSGVRPPPQNYTSLHRSLPTGERSPAVFLQMGGKPTFHGSKRASRYRKSEDHWKGLAVNCLSSLVVVVQLLSCVWLFATRWTAACQASLSFTISLNSCPFKLVMQSSHLFLCHPLLLLPSIFPSIRVFSSELALSIKWPKYWTFSFSISPPNEYSGMISFRIEWHLLLTPYKAESRVW